MKFVKNFQVLDCPSIAHNEGWIFLCFFRHGDVVDIWYMFLMMCWSAWSYVECSKIFPMCFFVFVCMQGKICIVKSYRSHVSGAGDLKNRHTNIQSEGSRGRGFWGLETKLTSGMKTQHEDGTHQNMGSLPHMDAV
jgi:hypothetical protein